MTTIEAGYRKAYDTIIIGGGIVGLSTADALVGRGQRVLVVERFEPATPRGSSHGDGRMIRLDYGEPVYVDMVRRAYEAWDTLATRVGERLMQRTGTCNFGTADSPPLAALEANLHALGIPYERLSASETSRRFPQYRLDRGSETIYQEEGGVLFADRIINRLWHTAQAQGADIITGVGVEDIQVEDDGVRVHSGADHAWTARHLVLAAGAWCGRWFDRLGLAVPLTVTQEQVAYFPSKGGIDHRVGMMPNGIDYHTPQPFYCVPQVTVPGVKAGWHHSGRVIEPDSPRPVDRANLEAVQAFIRRRCPHLDPEPFEVAPCLYTNSLDYHFIIDRHPVYPHVVFAAGLSGHGFKFGPVIGEILTALIYEAPLPVDITLFSVRRFAEPDKLVRRITA